MSQDPDKDRKDHNDDEPEGNLNPSWLNQLPHVGAKPDAGSKPEEPTPPKEVAKSKPEPELPDGTEISPAPPEAKEAGAAPDTGEAPWLEQLDKKKSDKRRVARTMLESDLPALGELYDEPSSRKKDKKSRKDKKDSKKIARTMLESDLPDLESISLKAEQAREHKDPDRPGPDIDERKVAKTMLEAEIPSMESLMPEPEQPEEPAPEPSAPEPSAPEPAPAPSETEPAPEPEPEPSEPAPDSRPVAKTMLEMEMPSSMELTGSDQDEQSAEPEEEPTSFEPIGSSPAYEPEPAPTPEPEFEPTVQAPAFDESHPPVESPLYEPAPFLQEEAPAADFRPVKRKTRLTGEVKLQRSFEPGSETAREEGETTQQRYVARTMLDTELIREQLAESIQRMEALAEEEVKRKALEPKPEFIAIDKFEIATPCKWKWNDEEITGHVAYCELCGIQVYNFEGLQLPEAQKIIFQREGKTDPTLYKRKDGKFMTQDCPVETRKSKNIRMIVIAIIAFFVFFVILIPLLSPKTPIGGAPVQQTPSQPPPAKTETQSDSEESGEAASPQSTGSPSSTNTKSTKTQSTGSTAPHAPGSSSSTAPQANPDGSFHWEAGKGVVNPPPAPVVTPTPQPVAPPDNSPYADESGQFWEYSK
ncbi:MAG: hypothetical protein AB7W16_08770 [Candidatus Obscuribacterales bacterium]